MASVPIVPEIVTERLVLRGHRESDLNDYVQQIYGEPQVTKWLPKRDISPTERTQKAITYFLDHWREFGFGTWIVIEKESGKLVGHCGLNVIKDTDEIEVLYALGPQHWGKGYATEAAKASLEFGFSSDVEWNGQKIEKIMAVALPDNKGSRKVMEKIGLRYVKDANYFGLDVVYYEITKAEFEKTK